MFAMILPLASMLFSTSARAASDCYDDTTEEESDWAEVLSLAPVDATTSDRLKFGTKYVRAKSVLSDDGLAVTFTGATGKVLGSFKVDTCGETTLSSAVRGVELLEYDDTSLMYELSTPLELKYTVSCSWSDGWFTCSFEVSD